MMNIRNRFFKAFNFRYLLACLLLCGANLSAAQTSKPFLRNDYAITHLPTNGSRVLCVTYESRGLSLEPCNGGLNQRWIRTLQGEIRSPQAQYKCVDVPGYNYKKYTSVIMYRCNGGGNQQWFARNRTIQTANSNLCLAPRNHRFVAGAKLVIAPCTDTAARRWNIGSVAPVVKPIDAARAGFRNFAHCYDPKQLKTGECYPSGTFTESNNPASFRYGYHVGKGHHAGDFVRLDFGDVSVDSCARGHDRDWEALGGKIVTIDGPSCAADRRFMRCLKSVLPRTVEEKEAKSAAIVAFSGPCTWFSGK